MATIIRTAVDLKSPKTMIVSESESTNSSSSSTSATATGLTGKSISTRGFSLKQRLVNLARNDNP